MVRKLRNRRSIRRSRKAEHNVRRSLRVEKLAQRQLMAADLGVIDSAFDENFLSPLQERINAEVFRAEAPLVGSQLADAGPAQFVTAIQQDLTALDFSSAPVTIADVEAGLAHALGSKVDPNGITHAGLDGDDEIRFHVPLTFTQSAAVDADLGLGDNSIVDIRLGNQDAVQIDLNISYDLRFGVRELEDGSSEFFLVTDQVNEIEVEVDAALRDDFAGGTGRMGVFVADFAAGEGAEGQKSHFTGSYSIDIIDANDGRLTASEFETLQVNGMLTGESRIYLEAQGKFLPQLTSLDRDNLFNLAVTTNVELDYSVEGARTNDVLDAAGEQVASLDPTPTIAYVDTRLDLGTLFRDFIDPTLTGIRDALRPVKPVVDLLTDPIPVLDIFTDKTFFDVAKLALTGKTEKLKKLAKAEKVVGVINRILDYQTPGADDMNGATKGLGSVEMKYSHVFGADPKDQQKKQREKIIADIKKGDFSFTEPTEQDTEPHASKQFFANFSGDLNFPLLTDSESIVSLLYGNGETSLFSADLNFELGFEYMQTIPIPQLLFLVNGELGFEVEASLDLGFGYDAKGVQDFSESIDFSNEQTYEDSLRLNSHYLERGFYIEDHNPHQIVDGTAVSRIQQGTLPTTLASDAEVSGTQLTVKDGTVFVDKSNLIAQTLDTPFQIQVGENRMTVTRLEIFDHDGDPDSPSSARLTLSEPLVNRLTAGETVITLDAKNEQPELTFKAAVMAGGSLGPDFKAIKAKAGLLGRFEVDINFDLNDLPDTLPPNSWIDPFTPTRPEAPSEWTYDGRIRMDELNAIMDVDRGALFNASGEVIVGLDLFAEVSLPGLDLLDVKKTIAETPLFNFNLSMPNDAEIINQDTSDVVLGEIDSNGIVRVYAGDLAGLRRDITETPGGDARDENFVVRSLGPSRDMEGSDVQVVYWFRDSGGRRHAYRQLFHGVKEVHANGGSGNDHLAGHPSLDIPVRFHGGDGDDVLFGGSGNDTLSGDGGHDQLHGGVGNDSIHGGTGDDQIQAGWGNDIAHGDSGNDEVFGEKGNDWLYGDGGSDRVFGGDGNDVAHGGDADDVVYGEDGNDEVYGDAGNDWLHGDALKNVILLTPEYNGHDTLYGGSGRDQLRGGNGNDTLWGGSDHDTIFGEGDHDELHGDAGNDTLYGDAIFNLVGGNDTLFGDAGEDKLHGSWGNDTLHGGDHDDVIYGEGNDDQLHGGNGNDTLYGDAILTLFGGNDTLFGDAGTDALHGGPGNDVLNGGADNDRAYGEMGADVVRGDAGDDTLYGDSIVNLAGGNDTVEGGDGNDNLHGGIGNDSLWGGNGNDNLYGESGNDHLHGGAGNDYLHGDVRIVVDVFAGNDTLWGDAGDDRMYGGFGADTMYGGDNNDTMYGNNGRDVMHGGSGNDYLNGGWHDDKLYGNDGHDKMYGDLGNDYLRGGNHNDYVHGGWGNDRLYGDNGYDKVYGDLGNDYLRGGNHNDYLDGGIGRDTIYGDAGNDTLNGGKAGPLRDYARDYLNGGSGSDKIYVVRVRDWRWWTPTWSWEDTVRSAERKVYWNYYV